MATPKRNPKKIRKIEKEAARKQTRIMNAANRVLNGIYYIGCSSMETPYRMELEPLARFLPDLAEFQQASSAILTSLKSDRRRWKYYQAIVLDDGDEVWLEERAGYIDNTVVGEMGTIMDELNKDLEQEVSSPEVVGTFWTITPSMSIDLVGSAISFMDFAVLRCKFLPHL